MGYELVRREQTKASLYIRPGEEKGREWLKLVRRKTTPASHIIEFRLTYLERVLDLDTFCAGPVHCASLDPARDVVVELLDNETELSS